MIDKIPKRFRLTEDERRQLEEFKKITGMTYSAIAEKSILIFINSNKVVRKNKINAKYKNYKGKSKTENIIVYFSKEAIHVISDFCVTNDCTLVDLFIEAFTDLQLNSLE